MPSSRYYRYPIIEKEEKFKKRKKIFFGFLGLITFGALLWLFFLSSIFEIREIKINHPDKISAEDASQTVNNLKLYSRFKFLYNLLPQLQKNLILMSKKRLAQNLSASFPEIRDLKINKNFFHVLYIEFNVRQQIGIWCDAKNLCYYVDSDGVIFSKAPESEGSLILKIQDLKKSDAELGEQVINTDMLKFLSDFREKLYNLKKISIAVYRLNGDKSAIEVLTGQGWSVYMEASKTADDLIKVLISTLDEAIKLKRPNLEYIDLRIPDRIFYKLR